MAPGSQAVASCTGGLPGGWRLKTIAFQRQAPATLAHTHRFITQTLSGSKILCLWQRKSTLNWGFTTTEEQQKDPVLCIQAVQQSEKWLSLHSLRAFIRITMRHWKLPLWKGQGWQKGEEGWSAPPDFWAILPSQLTCAVTHLYRSVSGIPQPLNPDIKS